MLLYCYYQTELIHFLARKSDREMWCGLNSAFQLLLSSTHHFWSYRICLPADKVMNLVLMGFVGLAFVKKFGESGFVPTHHYNLHVSIDLINKTLSSQLIYCPCPICLPFHFLIFLCLHYPDQTKVRTLLVATCTTVRLFPQKHASYKMLYSTKK